MNPMKALSLAACVAALGIASVYGCAPEEAPNTRPDRDTDLRDSGSRDEPVGDSSRPDPNDETDSGGGTVNLRASAAIAAVQEGAAISGTAEFEQVGTTLRIALELMNGPPGLRGMHVHGIGNCGDGGLAAGGHYNPGDAGHGLPDGAIHHAGDLGNIEIDGTGRASLAVTTSELALAGNASVVGRALVIHANPDDGTAGVDGGGPGNSGARIGCGVIQSKP